MQVGMGKGGGGEGLRHLCTTYSLMARTMHMHGIARQRCTGFGVAVGFTASPIAL